METPGNSAGAFAADSNGSERPGERRGSADRWVVGAAIAITFCAIALLVVGEWDISARRDLVFDVAMRGAGVPLPSPRFADPSPFAVWLSSDLHVHDSIRRGELPLWDRSQAGGYSPLAYLQGGVLHPMRLLTAFVPRESAPSVLIVLAIAAQFIGTYLTGRSVLGCAPISSVAGAVAAICGSYFLSLIHYSGALIAFVHTPWLLNALHRWLLERSRWRWLGIVFVASLLLLSGHPSFILAAGLCATLFGIAQLWGRPLRLWLCAVLVPIASALAAAIATIPFLRAFEYSWTYKFEQPAYEIFAFDEWVDAISWILFDDPFALRTIDYGAFYAHLGSVAIVLAIAGIWKLRTDRTTGAAVAAGVVLGLLIAVPGPWMSPLASVVPFKFAKGWYLFGVPYFFTTLGVIGGVELLRSIPVRTARWLPLLAILFLTLPSIPRISTVLDPAPLRSRPLASDATRFLHAQPGVFRITGLGGQLLLPNAGVWSGTEDLRITAPMLSRRYLRWLELADPEGARFSDATLKQNLDVGPMLGAFNVGYVLQGKLPFRIADSWIPREKVKPPIREGANEKGFERPREIKDPRLVLAFENEVLRIYRNQLGYRPRVWLTREYVRASDMADAERILASNGGASAVSPVVEVKSAPLFEAQRSFQWRTALRVDEQSAVEIAVESSQPALLILNESFDSGWSVRVDGRNAPIHPVNLIARGVFVPAGNSMVRFEYSPPGFRIGAIASVLTILALCIFAASGSP
jgi:hypothetical protein